MMNRRTSNSGAIAAYLAAAIAVVLLTTPATWAASLVSMPLKGGAGGSVCACTNLTSDRIQLDIALIAEGGSASCPADFLFIGSCSLGSPVTRICRVTRQDSSKLTTKHVSCSLVSLDASGNPVAVVPVNQRRR